MNAKLFLTLTIIIFTTTAVVISTLPPTHAANWQTVTTITGSSDQTTSTFAITANEWRIQWSYTPDPQYPQYSFFSFEAYPQYDNVNSFSFLSALGNNQTSNTEYITDAHFKGAGNYYLRIWAANIPNYTITIQQNQVNSSTTNPTNTSNASTTGIPIEGLVELLVIIIMVVVFVALLVRLKKPHAPVVQNNLGDDLAGRLDKLKELLDSNLISKEEYEEKKKEILSQV